MLCRNHSTGHCRNTGRIMLKMIKHIILANLFLCIGYFLTETDAVCSQRSICQTNDDAASKITGDDPNAIKNFLDVISSKELFHLDGDSQQHPWGCIKPLDKNKQPKRRRYLGIEWIIECWEPTECMLVDGYERLQLFPVSSSVKNKAHIRTVFLPLQVYETATYTHLPFHTDRSMMFATTLLSGCSVFVLKSHNMDCMNLVVIHTNYNCRDRTVTGGYIDFNHRQAMAVLEEVESNYKYVKPSLVCSYFIERRWAEEKWRPAIEAANHHYAERIQYYNYDYGATFFYGSYPNEVELPFWKFCTKTASASPPKERCYRIDYYFS